MSPQRPFDPFAELYDGWFATPLGHTVDLLEKDLIARFLASASGKRALDVGTGTGHFAAWLSGQGARAVGVDISRLLLRVAARKKGMAPLVQADAEALPFADGAFDAVLSVTALEFMGNPAKAVSEMARVCRPGGCMVIGVLNSWSPWAWSRRKQARRDPQDPFGAAHFYSPPEFAQLLSPHGSVYWGSSVFVLPDGKGLGRAWALERIGRKMLKPFGALLVGRLDL
jgi:ubiquinone/menaquinone biosynthesis C-methylase UbiE